MPAGPTCLPDLRQPGLRPLRGLVGQRPGSVGAVLEQVAVLVEDVVHDLEEQADLVARTPATAPARARGTSATQSAHATKAEKRQPVLSRCSEARSVWAPATSRYWPPIMPSVA